MARKRFEFSAADRAAVDATPIERAVLSKTVDDGVRALEGAKLIQIERLRPDPDQPRRHIDELDLEALADSIRAEGVLQPIAVRYVAEEDCFVIISGERRWRAAQRAGLAAVPAIVRRVSDDRIFVHQLVENLQRSDLSDVERGLALERLKQLTGASWEAVAEMVGLHRRRALQLQSAARRLSPIVQEAVAAGRISGRHARFLTGLAWEEQDVVADVAAQERLTSDQTAAVVDALRRPRIISAGKRENPSLRQRVVEAAEATRQQRKPAGVGRRSTERMAPAMADGTGVPAVVPSDGRQTSGASRLIALAEDLDVALAGQRWADLNQSDRDAVRPALRRLAARIAGLPAESPA